VQEFLKTKTLMPTFLDNVFGTIDISVADYLKRGFDQLSISFGCTGGQHRSVYAAEQTKQHLKAVFDIDATVLHLEQDPNDHARR
jgi:RNase adaptor protein for sRNA GlmZ degradation